MIDQLLSRIPEQLQAWLIIGVPAVVTYIIGLILFRVVRIVFKRRGFEEHQMIEKARKPTSLLFALLVARLFAEQQFGVFEGSLSQIFQILVIGLLSWLTIQLVAIGRYLLTRQYDIDVDHNLKARKVYTQIKVFERIVIVVILVTGISLCLMTFDSIKNLGASILASAGIVSVIVGLAAQKLIANLIAGFQIAVTQPIRLDDVVIVEGEWGKIEEITLTYVVIRIWDERRLVVPSSQFIEKPFQNWTRNNSDILGTVFIHVDYKLPVGVVRERLSEILKSTDLWDGKTDVLQVTNLTDRTMELRALMSAKDSSTAWDLRVHVRENLINFLQEEYPEYLPKARVSIEEENPKDK
ncbi:MAG: mechanosensitive ion channel [Cyclobacteriaceae bacterium]